MGVDWSIRRQSRKPREVPPPSVHRDWENDKAFATWQEAAIWYQGEVYRLRTLLVAVLKGEMGDTTDDND